MEYVTLNNGVKMPMEGFGVYQVDDLKECENSVLTAIEVGYRSIDTAALYRNETAVGDAIVKCGVPRDELFITSKVWVDDMTYEGTRKAIERSLKWLKTDYLDLYLIHQQMGDVFGAWRAMEEAYGAGKIRAIGISNFYPDTMVNFIRTVDATPAVNQIETHPFYQREELLACMKEYNVAAEAWAPFAEGHHGIFTDPVLTGIGKKYGKTAAQVALRWNIDRGVMVIPKSVHRERIIQNLNVWDFKLDAEDMKAIAAMDLNYTELAPHHDPKFVEILHNLKSHD